MSLSMLIIFSWNPIPQVIPTHLPPFARKADSRATRVRESSCEILTKHTDPFISSMLLVDGTKTVSGSLDEEEAEDITKGFTITSLVGGGFRLHITDGFSTDFDFRVLESVKERDFYSHGDTLKIAFILDGGPKVS